MDIGNRYELVSQRAGERQQRRCAAPAFGRWGSTASLRAVGALIPSPRLPIAPVQIRDIGSGNFGVAKLCRAKDSGELVAVKFIERGEKVGAATGGSGRGRSPRKPAAAGQLHLGAGAQEPAATATRRPPALPRACAVLPAQLCGPPCPLLPAADRQECRAGNHQPPHAVGAPQHRAVSGGAALRQRQWQQPPGGADSLPCFGGYLPALTSPFRVAWPRLQPPASLLNTVPRVRTALPAATPPINRLNKLCGLPAHPSLPAGLPDQHPPGHRHGVCQRGGAV